MEEQNTVDMNDPMIKEALFQAIQEVIDEEAAATYREFDSRSDGVKGYEDGSSFELEQDISGILEDAQLERDMRADGLIQPEKGTRKFATVPVGIMVEYANSFGVDIMGEEVSKDKWEMAKFRTWLSSTYPELLVREKGKTKFHTMT